MTRRTGSATCVGCSRRPATCYGSRKCDKAFPERKGWFTDFYNELRTWAPPGFRDWSEYEDKARELIVWVPNIVDGLAQTEAYAPELMDGYPGVVGDMAER